MFARRSSRRSVCGFAVVALMTLVSNPARSGPSKDFPEFAGHKANLGKMALVTDVVVVEDVIGTTEKVYREDCLSIGHAMMDLLAEDLGAKGYTFANRTVVSVGNLASTKVMYRVLDRWEQHKQPDGQFPVKAPPFYVDSTLCASDSARAAWHDVLAGVWSFEKKKNKPAPVLTSVTGLRDAIGADYAMVVVVAGTKIPFGKQLGQGMLSGPVAKGSSGNVSYSVGLDFTQYSGTGLKLAVLDVKTGDVLWSDGDHEDKSLDEDRVKGITKDVVKRMP